MLRVLVLYGTTDGHTARVADAMAAAFQRHGVWVDVVEAPKRAADDVGLERYAAVVVAGSIQMGHYPRALERFVRANADHLSRPPSAFVSVCLGVLEHKPNVDAEIAAIMARFFEATGWTPTVRKVVAGALPYTRYSWLKRWVMKRIVAKAGGDTDTSRDYVYTDWKDLDAFVDTFHRDYLASLERWARTPTPAA